MNKRNCLRNIILITSTVLTSLFSQTQVLTPSGEIVTKPSVNAPQTNNDSLISFHSGGLSYSAWMYYESNKLEKAHRLLMSSLIPGFGFNDTQSSQKGFIYFLASCGLLYLGIEQDDPDKAKLFFIGYSVLRITELFDLSATVDKHNEALRYQLKTKFNLR